MTVTGRCLCGAVRWESSEPAIVTRVCWCRDCQYFGAGSGTVREYTITYPPQKLPASYGKELIVKIQLNGDGSDYIGDRATKAELERVYEMAAQAKLAANAPAQAPAH